MDSYKHPSPPSTTATMMTKKEKTNGRSLIGWIVNTPRGSIAGLFLLLPPFLLYRLSNETSMLIGSGGKFQASKTTAKPTSNNNKDGGGDPERNRWIHYSHCSRNDNSNTTPNPLPRDWCLDDDRVPRYVGERNGTERNRRAGPPALHPRRVRTVSRQQNRGVCR